jgi:hypothetical protein
MNLLKRIVAVVGSLLALAMLLLGVAGGIGVWIVKAPITDRTTRIFGRIDTALDLGNQGLDHVKTSLANAEERLANVREEQRKIAQEPRSAGTVRRLMARTIQQRVAPEVGNAHQKIHTVAEAAVLVNSVVEDLGNLPFLSTTGLDSSRLSEINNSLSAVESSAWELTRLLGEPDLDSDAVAQLSQMEQTLKTLQGLVAEYEPQFRQVRERTDMVQAKILRWITPVTAITSFVCFWIALSQISVLVHTWSWLKH